MISESECQQMNISSSVNTLKEYSKTLINKYKKFVVYMINICEFDLFSYTFGYEESDFLLDRILKEIKKTMDREACILRFMGDKFVVLAPYSEENSIFRIKSQIAEACEKDFYLNNAKVNVHIEMGISIYPKDGEDLITNLKYSNIALNYLKENNGANYEFFKPYMYSEILRRGKVSNEIDRALNNNELMLYYQPQIDIKSMKVYGLEALIRWNHPSLGILSPGYFIDVIEENGMINEVGKFVLYEACSQIKKWNDLGYSKLCMSINIAESQLNDKDFVAFVKKIIKETGVKAEALIFEITERLVFDLSKENIDIFNELRDLGIKIFIDDFGTKYSNLNYLYNLPIDGIKIDKCFIDKIENSPKNLIITKSMVDLAYDLNLEVVAEGVEKKEQLNYLSNIKCNKVQGFIFQRPVSSMDIIDFINKF